MKDIISGIIIGIILTCGVVVATTVISANEIDYDQNNTVKDKLDDLYTKSGRVFESSDITTSRNASSGETTKSTSITLNKGRYIVYTDAGLAWPSDNGTNSINRETTADNITCSNCTYNRIYGWLNEPHCTNQFTSGYNFYESVSTLTRLYYLEVTADNTVITATAITGHSNPNKLAQFVGINAIKID